MVPKLVESIFDPIVEVFLFLDKDGKGKLNKADVIKTLNNEDYPLERSPSHVTNMRFGTYKSCTLLSSLYSMCFIQMNSVYSLLIGFYLFLCGAEEMDWGRKGKVGFREFLFAFMSWVGLDDAEDYYMSS